MKKVHKILKQTFPDAEVLENRDKGFWFVKPAFCNKEQEMLIKDSLPNVGIVNTKGADGKHTLFVFKVK